MSDIATLREILGRMHVGQRHPADLSWLATNGLHVIEGMAPSDPPAPLDPDTLFFDLPIGISVDYSRGYSAAITACKDALRAALGEPKGGTE